MAHWIITNRPFSEEGEKKAEGTQTGLDILNWSNAEANRAEANAGGKGERDGAGGLPVFRVGRFDPGAGPTGRDLAEAVRFVRDAYIGGYGELRRPGDAGDIASPAGLPGTLEMFGELYRDMRAAPSGKGDALVFIHGYNYSWEDSLRHLQRLIRVYAEPAASPISHVIYFSWPSRGQIERYRSDQEIALPAGLNFGRLFAKVVQFFRDAFRPSRAGAASTDPLGFCGKRLHVAAHSMGAQVLDTFIQSIVAVPSLRVPIFSQALLLNADLDWTGLERGNALHDLPSYADRIHVYNHRDDDALLISETTKNGERRLGRHGPRTMADGVISDRTVVVDCSKLHLSRREQAVVASVRGPGMAAARGATMGAAADVATEAAADRFLETARHVLRGSDRSRERLFDHWGYLHRPEVVADIYRVLAGVSASEIPGRDRRDTHRYALLPG